MVYVQRWYESTNVQDDDSLLVRHGGSLGYGLVFQLGGGCFVYGGQCILLA